jgi:DNA polymerase III subunit beta
MKLAIAKEQLLAGLQAVQNVVSTRTSMPILANLQLLATEGELEFTATDLDVTVVAKVNASVSQPGRVTLPARKFGEIARELPAGEVELSVDDKAVCSVRAGSSFFKVRGLPADDFPATPVFAQSRAVVLPQEKVRAMLKRTSFAASVEESRYTLNGIFFSFKDSKATMVATDGRRLALTDEASEIAADNQGEFIVPTKAINELKRLLTSEGSLEVKFSENRVCFTLKSDKTRPTEVISKLVEGNYPNYLQVIPRDTSERVTLVREELVAAVRRAELMTTDKNSSVKLTFSRNQLTITSNTPEVGEASETLAINYKGKDFAIAFNPVYLREPLEALDTDEVYIDLIDELSPGVIKATVPFLYVIMPMRLS